MLNSIKTKSETISLEAISGTQVYKLVAHRLPSFFADVKNFVTGIVSEEAPRVQFVEVKEAEKAIGRTIYADLRHVTVYVPAGLNVHYLDYVDALHNAVSVNARMVKETLAPFNAWLAQMLTNPEGLSAQRAPEALRNFIFHDIDSVKKGLAACFKKGSVETEVPFGKIAARNGDWKTIVDKTNDLIQLQSAIDPKEVRDMVNSITANLDTLLRRMEEDKDMYRASAVTVDFLSKLCYNLGLEIEFFSVTAYQLKVLEQALNDSNERLKEILTK